MRIELDHLFVCTSPGAPEAEKLVRLGLREGPPNQHAGQGTASRRFSFLNAMIELVWVSDAIEAKSPTTACTLLWERWSNREGQGCPFGICLRPVDADNPELPFPGWDYRPAYLPEPFFMHIGDAGVEEPMWVYLSFMRRAQREQWFVEHPIGVREITGLVLTSPTPILSPVAQLIVESGILSVRVGTKPVLEIEFDRKQRNESVDFRPHLPFIFQL